MWEERYNSVASHFVTLTYNTEHVPLTPNGFMSLCKADLQKFFKRLRKNTGLTNIKYYACGEYGSKTNRPHYHAIIMNVSDAEEYVHAWTLNGSQIGGVDVGTCTGDSVAYTMKYIEKDSYTQKRNRYRHARDDRELEFALMSKGLGAGYVDLPGVRQFHVSDLSRNYVVKDGYKIALPRYYKKSLYDEYQLQVQRDIIVENVEIRQKKERYLFVSSQEFPTYADRKEAEREGRKQKFLRKQQSRNKL